MRALHAVGKRGIIFEGSSGSELFRLGLDKLDASKPDAAEVAAWAAKNVLVTGGVSHEWLFPKVAAIVHHGGAGTSAASFRAGVPSLVTPFGNPLTLTRTPTLTISPTLSLTLSL